MKVIKRILKWALILIFSVIVGLYITGNGYVVKAFWVVYLHGHTSAYIDDFQFFENDTIPASSNPQPWPIHKNYNTGKPSQKLRETNLELGTIAFLIIKNDSIWFEEYKDGFNQDSHTNSFSMAKSITSAMLGKAIEDGFIKSLDQPVGDFYPHFSGTGLTVGDLSSMSSGLNWNEAYKNPFGMTARAYYDGDLAENILKLKVVDTPGVAFKYLSGNTELLAMVLEKATKNKLSTYLYESFWNPIGAKNYALWQVDDKENRLAKAYCCLGSNARDFARFGKLYRDYGKWNGQQLLDSAFVAKSITPRFEESPEYGYGFWLSDFMGKEIFAMRGILGQYVIVIPEDDIIIVRLGRKVGKRTDLPFSSDFYTYIEETYEMFQNRNL
ncbi:serine hydrolase domain-containing protein [Aequorivita viscosa]|uniref:CubicO group peptidase, beta-lactamase class C family n=1 Tax=Aequorivita viscosa TaxID=797419 RepID=A0A1M6DPU7_9FLAO|nr:serine hydrolase [Aequorivita viscosa]SDW50324.1 CubicO group peptidase, beta-lactamase class C family [Aequorivita viscosa]SHI75237.1 CubicO group peptidase, beta-lactamase class C family [Aequorivita viscosa]